MFCLIMWKLKQLLISVEVNRRILRSQCISALEPSYEPTSHHVNDVIDTVNYVLCQCYVWVWPAKCRYTQGQPCIPVSCEEQTLCM